MKILPYLLAVLFASSALGAPTTLSQAKQVIVALKTELVAAKEQVSSTQMSLELASQSVVAANSRVAVLETQIDKLAKSEALAWQTVSDQQTKIDKIEAKLLQTGRERDLFLLAFAIAGAAYAYTFLRPILLAAVPPPYNIAATPAAALLSFVGCFYAGRIIVAQTVHLVF